MAKAKNEPVAIGGAAMVGLVSVLVGISEMFGLELDAMQIGGAVAVIIAIVTALQRRKTKPFDAKAEKLKASLEQERLK